MSDEAAFLEALEANPADDTARLVYADWLDEHDRPQSAQYLRAVVDLARLPGGTPEYTDAAVRLFTMCGATGGGWRMTAGARFDVVLEGYDPASKIPAIKVIRELIGCGLAEAKGLSESCPSVLFSWLPFETALPRVLTFHNRGYQNAPTLIRAAIRTTTLPMTVPEGTYDIVLHKTNVSARLRYPASELAHALGFTTERTMRLLGQLPAIVATALKPADVPALVLRLKTICCYGSSLPPNAITVIPHVLPT